VPAKVAYTSEGRLPEKKQSLTENFAVFGLRYIRKAELSLKMQFETEIPYPFPASRFTDELLPFE
jgi:hypothetical protein